MYGYISLQGLQNDAENITNTLLYFNILLYSSLLVISNIVIIYIK